MATTLSTAARNAACDAVAALANGGKLKIKDASTVLVTITLPATAFDAASTGVATARGDDGTNPISGSNPLTGTGTAAGDADNFDVTTSADAVLWSGGAAELDLVNANIAIDQPVEITNFTHTQPAS